MKTKHRYDIGFVNPTDNQLIHRQYLCSPIWKEKRIEALTYYGCLCNRCGEYGNDVHHKTYERVGGRELMEDLEILCRDCHRAHHRAEKAMRYRYRVSGKRTIPSHQRFSYLTEVQKEILIRRFDLKTEGVLSIQTREGIKHPEVFHAVKKMLGILNITKEAKKSISATKHHQREMDEKKKKDGTWVPLKNIVFDEHLMPKIKRQESRIVKTRIRKIDYYDQHFGKDAYAVAWPSWITY